MRLMIEKERLLKILQPPPPLMSDHRPCWQECVTVPICAVMCNNPVKTRDNISHQLQLHRSYNEKATTNADKVTCA